MKRYKDGEELPKKHKCLICGRRGRTGTKSLVANGWLKTTKGLVCPSCPD